MRQWLAFCSTALFWGGSFVAIKYVLTGMAPIVGATLRVGLGGLIVSTYVLLSGQSLRLPEGLWPRVYTAGLFVSGIPFAFLFWAETRVSAGLSGIMNGTLPLFTFVLGLVVARGLEPFSLRKLAGLLLGMVGLLVIFAPLLGNENQLAGTLALSAMALSYGIGTIANRKLFATNPDLSLPATVAHQLLSSLLLLVILTLGSSGFGDLTSALKQPRVTIALVYLATFSTAAAFFSYCYLIREWGAVRAAAITYVVPIIGLVFQFVFFSQLPTMAEVLGCGLILSGVYLLQSVPRVRRVAVASST